MKLKHALLGIVALALCAYLPATSAGAFTSPLVSPLPTPTPVVAVCGYDLGCTEQDGTESCVWLIKNNDPTYWQRKLIARPDYCQYVPCAEAGGSILSCAWPAGTEWAQLPVPVPTSTPIPQPTVTPTPEWLHSRHPGLEPEVTPEPTPAPSTWQDAGLWQGVYLLLVNERGEYCLPELAGCE